jgi:hypothetical protein
MVIYPPVLALARCGIVFKDGDVIWVSIKSWDLLLCGEFLAHSVGLLANLHTSCQKVFIILREE